MNYFYLILTASIFVIFFAVADYLQERSLNQKQVERGLFDPPCPKRETAFIRKRVEDDWKGAKTMYPRKYVEYFYYDPAALTDYQNCLIWDIQCKSGYIPDYIPNSYNKYYYDPFVFFVDKHKYKITKFYKTRSKNKVN